MSAAASLPWGPIDLSEYDLVMVEFKSWSAMGKTHIVAIGVYQRGTEVYRKNLGTATANEDILASNTASVAIYALGQHITAEWRSLSERG